MMMRQHQIDFLRALQGCQHLFASLWWRVAGGGWGIALVPLLVIVPQSCPKLLFEVTAARQPLGMGRAAGSPERQCHECVANAHTATPSSLYPQSTAAPAAPAQRPGTGTNPAAPLRARITAPLCQQWGLRFRPAKMRLLSFDR